MPKRQLTKEARNRISEAQKQRWSKFRGQKTSTAKKSGEYPGNGTVIHHRAPKLRSVARRDTPQRQIITIIANLLRMLPDDKLVEMLKVKFI